MERLEGTAGASKSISKVRYSHDAMIDHIISNPGIKQNDLALIFGYTASWISMVINSDAFQARLADRRGELVTPAVAESIENRLKGMASRSLELLAEKLDEEDVDTATLFKAVELSTKSLGYGARQTNVAIQNNLINANTISDEDLLEIAKGG